MHRKWHETIRFSAGVPELRSTFRLDPLLGLMLCCVAASGEPLVLDFNHLPPGPTQVYTYIGYTYAERGFILSATDRNNPIAFFHTNEAPYTGSVALTDTTQEGIMSLSRTNGGFFDFFGIDLAGKQPWPTAPEVTFEGYRGRDVVIRTNFAHSGQTRLEGFVAHGFTGLTEVRWQNTWPGHQFDNIVLETSSNAPPPCLLMRLVNSTAFVDLFYLEVNATYILQRSRNLVDWEEVRTFQAPSPAVLQWDDFVSDKGFYRFYRVE